MERYQFIEHKGKKILLLEFAEDWDESMKTMEKVRPVINSQPAKSMLILTDVSKAAFNTKGAEALKQFCKENSPYVKASCVVGVSGLKKVLLRAVEAFISRSFNLFDDIESAKDWLVSQ